MMTEWFDHRFQCSIQDASGQKLTYAQIIQKKKEKEAKEAAERAAKEAEEKQAELAIKGEKAG